MWEYEVETGVDDPPIEDGAGGDDPPVKPPASGVKKFELPDGYDPLLDGRVKKTRDQWAAAQASSERKALDYKKQVEEQAKRLADLEDAEKSDVQKLTAQIERSNERQTQILTQLQEAENKANAAEVKYLRHSIAQELVLPNKLVKYITGDTEDEIRESVTHLKDDFNASTSSIVPDGVGAAGDKKKKPTKVYSQEDVDKLLEEAAQRNKPTGKQLDGSGGNSKQLPIGEKKIWKRSEISNLSSEEYKKNKAEINAAKEEGRIVDE